MAPRDDRAETILNLTLNVLRGMAINSLWQNDPALYDSSTSRSMTNIASGRPVLR
jgi:hypothetical protein